MLDVLTLLIMGVLLGAVLYAAYRLAALPGQIASRRGHPQADAINVAGWLGLLTLGLLWPIALVWAFTRPQPQTPSGPELRYELERISERIGALEQREEGRAR